MKKDKKVAKVSKVVPAKKSEKKKTKTGPAIGERKNLLYKYPADCKTLDARKLFRASARKKSKTLRKNWKLVESGKREGNVAEAKAAYFKFKKANFAKAEEAK